MLKLMDDPDRFDRFNSEDKAAIREIARGVSFFAKIRFDHLHEAIRRRGIPYMPEWKAEHSLTSRGTLICRGLWLDPLPGSWEVGGLLARLRSKARR